MRLIPLFALLLCANAASAAPDYAALREAELTVIERQFGAFREAARQQSAAAMRHCVEGGDFLPAYRAARRAWAPLEAYQFGPMEQQAAALSINFWPDKKGFVNRALRGFLSQPEDVLTNPEAIARQSAALHGFPAIEALLGDENRPTCPAIIGISGHIAHLAEALYEGWQGSDGWADLARQAGPENPVYLNDREFTTEIFTALNYVLFRMREQALKRPLGDRTGPKPHRAEGWQTGESLAIIAAQISGIEEMVNEGYGPALSPETRAEISRAAVSVRRHIAGMMPLAEAVADPQGLWQIEGLQNKIAYLAMLLDTKVGPVLSVASGFSPADGD